MRLRVGMASATAFAAAFTLFCGVTAPCARADDTIKHPGDHPKYHVEIEPHGLVSLDQLYASSGFGVGGRFSIPIVQNGFISSINNSVAISFGLDLVHYSGCYFRDVGCNANYLFFPVAMQWNFFVAERWSVFGEPGLFVYNGFIDTCPAGAVGCANPTTFGVRPAIYLGGRYHFNENVSLTMRIGYPTFSIGVSFFP